MTQKQMLEMLQDHLRISGFNEINLMDGAFKYLEHIRIVLEWIDDNGGNPVLIDQTRIPKVGPTQCG